jgi:hypothetical protein
MLYMQFLLGFDRVNICQRVHGPFSYIESVYTEFITLSVYLISSVPASSPVGTGQGEEPRGLTAGIQIAGGIDVETTYEQPWEYLWTGKPRSRCPPQSRHAPERLHCLTSQRAHAPLRNPSKHQNHKQISPLSSSTAPGTAPPSSLATKHKGKQSGIEVGRRGKGADGGPGELVVGMGECMPSPSSPPQALDRMRSQARRSRQERCLAEADQMMVAMEYERLIGDALLVLVGREW